MVPHRTALRTLALLGLARAEGDRYVLRRAAELEITFPVSPTQFRAEEVYPFIDDALEAYFLTTDPSLEKTYEPLYRAINQLGLSDFVSMTGEGPDILVPQSVAHWRRESQARIFIETSLLCGVSPSLVAEDMKKVWGKVVDSNDIRVFRDLFVDLDFSTGEYWDNYVRCIGAVESQFKSRLRKQPQHYVRYRLGVPVELNSRDVLNRLVSDAHFTEEHIKAEYHDAAEIPKEQLARIKMERDTVFKGLDRIMKMDQYESENGGGPSDSTLRDTLNRIKLKYRANDFPLRSTVIADGPTLNELNDG